MSLVSAFSTSAAKDAHASLTSGVASSDTFASLRSRSSARRRSAALAAVHAACAAAAATTLTVPVTAPLTNAAIPRKGCRNTRLTSTTQIWLNQSSVPSPSTSLTSSNGSPVLLGGTSPDRSTRRTYATWLPHGEKHTVSGRGACFPNLRLVSRVGFRVARAAAKATSRRVSGFRSSHGGTIAKHTLPSCTKAMDDPSGRHEKADCTPGGGRFVSGVNAPSPFTRTRYRFGTPSSDLAHTQIRAPSGEDLGQNAGPTLAIASTFPLDARHGSNEESSSKARLGPVNPGKSRSSVRVNRRCATPGGGRHRVRTVPDSGLPESPIARSAAGSTGRSRTNNSRWVPPLALDTSPRNATARPCHPPPAAFERRYPLRPIQQCRTALAMPSTSVSGSKASTCDVATTEKPSPL